MDPAEYPLRKREKIREKLNEPMRGDAFWARAMNMAARYRRLGRGWYAWCRDRVAHAREMREWAEARGIGLR